jgi:hypothetical protein
MADTYYAFSTIRYGATVDEASGTIMSVDEKAVGETVSQSDLGLNDDQWEQLVDSGAIRTYEYPPVEGDQTPATYYKENAAKAVEAAESGMPFTEIMGVPEPLEEGVRESGQLVEAAPAATAAKAKATSGSTSS